MTRSPTTPPAYCCAILRDREGRFLLELRPATDPDCPGRLTCFGGSRQGEETPQECLSRELLEELGTRAELDHALHPDLVLHTPAGEAWFFELPAPADARACEAGHSAVWITGDPAKDPRIADWHRAAFEALREGRKIAYVGRPDASRR